LATGFVPLTVVPRTLRYDLLLTLSTPASHHDPAVQDDSNRQLFNRQKQLLPGDVSTVMPGQPEIDALCAMHPVPGDIVDIVRQLAFPEFVAVCLVRTFMDQYNSLDGIGLFSGQERYSRLEARCRLAAISAPNLRAWWNRLCDQMQVPIHGGDQDWALLKLLSLPVGLQQLVLRVLTRDYRSVLAVARLWHSTAKLQNDSYALKAQEPVAAPSLVLSWSADSLASIPEGASVIDVPVVSGNSLRHQVVREPSWRHLCAALGLSEAEPGKGAVPPGVEAIFYNGGNIAAGAKQPSNTHALSQRIRQTYPSLDLLGGVTDSFDLGESRLQVAGWLVCAENREALRGSPAYDLPSARISAFEMLDDVTLTRQAGLVGLGQMVYSFEALCTGAQILCRLSLSPWTPALTRGALVAAVETYLEEGATVGGQAARGFGHCQGEWLARPGDDSCEGLLGDSELRQRYEGYLEANRESLLAGMCDGTLGTGARVLT